MLSKCGPALVLVTAMIGPHLAKVEFNQQELDTIVGCVLLGVG